MERFVIDNCSERTYCMWAYENMFFENEKNTVHTRHISMILSH